ncbi:unnamed protein product, partial [Ectocarpus fasciculatus]
GDEADHAGCRGALLPQGGHGFPRLYLLVVAVEPTVLRSNNGGGACFRRATPAAATAAAADCQRSDRASRGRGGGGRADRRGEAEEIAPRGGLRSQRRGRPEARGRALRLRRHHRGHGDSGHGGGLLGARPLLSGSRQGGRADGPYGVRAQQRGEGLRVHARGGGGRPKGAGVAGHRHGPGRGSGGPQG